MKDLLYIPAGGMLVFQHIQELYRCNVLVVEIVWPVKATAAASKVTILSIIINEMVNSVICCSNLEYAGSIGCSPSIQQVILSCAHKPFTWVEKHTHKQIHTIINLTENKWVENYISKI